MAAFHRGFSMLQSKDIAYQIIQQSFTGKTESGVQMLTENRSVLVFAIVRTSTSDGMLSIG